MPSNYQVGTSLDTKNMFNTISAQPNKFVVMNAFGKRELQPQPSASCKWQEEAGWNRDSTEPSLQRIRRCNGRLFILIFDYWRTK